MLIVNPLTTVAFFEIYKQGKHAAIVNNAAAGALGQMVLRLGRTRNIPVIHVVRREAQVELLRSSRAEHVLNSSDKDLGDQLHRLSLKLKATLILDPVGGEQTDRLLEATPSASLGLVYGSLGGIKADQTSQIVGDLPKHVEGFFTPNWLATKNTLQVIGYLSQVQRLAKKELRTKIQERFPLAQVQDAVALYQTNPTAGKVLLLGDSA